MVQHPDANHPRFRPESWTVRCKQSEPSMLMLHIADGSILQDRTLHAKARSRGRRSLPKISENQVEYQQSDEAEDKGVGGMFLVAVSVGLGDHFVADHIEHCAAGEGQHHRQ